MKHAVTFENAAPVTEKNALLIGFKSLETTRLRLNLREAGFANIGSFCTFRDVGRSTIVFGSITHLFVNIDGFGNLGQAIEWLADMRKWRQDLTVIASSEHVRDDDFGSDRKRICDATIRLPVSPERLKKAITSAERNNVQISHHRMAPQARMLRTSPL